MSCVYPARTIMLKNQRDRLHRLLRWSERYTKTDMVYFVRGNFWLNVNRAASVLNGFILSVAFAHLLTKDAYGTYTYALALMGLFSMPQTTALGAGMSKGVARGEDGIVLEGLRRVFPYSLAGAVLLGGLGAYYWYMHNMTLAISFIVGALVLPLSVTNSAGKAILSSKGNFGPMARFNFARTPVMTAALVAAAWLTGSALWIIVVNTIGNLLLGTMLYLRVRRMYDLSRAPRTQERFEWRYAFHSGILSIFSYLSDQLDDLLLWKFLGAAPVAVYTYAIAPVREIRALIENQSAVAMPKFAQKSLETVRANLLFRIRQMYLIAVPLAVAYVVAAPLIFRIFFHQYMDAVFLSQVATLSLLSAPRRLMNGAITAHQRVKESYITIIMPSVVRITLACIFIPMWGLWGAVWALLIAELIDYAVLGLLMRGLKEQHA